jgi:hypothetical protein
MGCPVARVHAKHLVKLLQQVSSKGNDALIIWQWHMPKPPFEKSNVAACRRGFPRVNE